MPVALFGQQSGADSTTTDASDSLSLVNELAPDLGLNMDKKKKSEESKKKVKVPKNVFYGLKAKKNFTKIGKGDRQVVELFYTLVAYQEPDAYVRDVYWYDAKAKKITTAARKEKEATMLLHGPYKKLVGGKVVEEGFYYAGVKHGRWEKYRPDFTLLEKTKYYRGFPKESEIKFYDVKRTKIKEVIPKVNGVLHGDYFAFYEGGQVATEGKYEIGVKVGKWMDYYQFRKIHKKETQYPKDPYDTNTDPVVLREWDEKGKVLFDREKETKTDSRSKF